MSARNTMDAKAHWEKVYRTKGPEEVSWYRPHLDRVAYMRQVAHAVKPGGHVIVATFGPEGPTKCSGLNVVRYGADALHDEFGSDFLLVKHLTELHQTPTGAIQQFTYCYCNISSGR